MVWLKLTCGFHWAGLAWQPIPMVTSFPTSPHYQSGCSFLRSHHCCRSCHQSHLWGTFKESAKKEEKGQLTASRKKPAAKFLVDNEYLHCNGHITQICIVRSSFLFRFKVKEVLTSTKSTVSSMASRTASWTIATEVASTRRLTVVSGPETTREPKQDENISSIFGRTELAYRLCNIKFVFPNDNNQLLWCIYKIYICIIYIRQVVSMIYIW